MSRGYSHLPSGPSAGDGLLELEELHPQGGDYDEVDGEDEDEGVEAPLPSTPPIRRTPPTPHMRPPLFDGVDSGDEEDGYGEEELDRTPPLPVAPPSSSSSPLILRVDVPPHYPPPSSSSTPSPTSAEEDGGRDSSLSLSSFSRHSESHPFDQDVHHSESSPRQSLHPTAATTPTGPSSSLRTPPATLLPSAHTGAVAASTSFPSSAAAPPSTIPASLPSSSSAPPSESSPPHLLQVPTSSLRKSVSIGDKLAGRAREIAVREGRRLESLVRGLEDGEVDYVEDHILETLDYDNEEDTHNELTVEKGGALHTNYLLLLKVFMMVLIGFVTAMLMYGVSGGVQLLYSNKVQATIDLIQGGQGAAAYFAFLFMNVAITAVGSSLVAIVAPHARGGGVPYALSYLNGTNVADYFSPRIVLVKAASLIFTISGGLTLGMEGPFVFIGGGVALLCSNLIDRVFPFFFVGFGGGRRGAFSRVIRNIREERIFMAGGLAAGLAVAFDAPIAGVLFALEGSTTFLTVPTVLRIFGCAMFASFFNDLGHNNFSSQVINHNLIQPTTDGSPPWAFSIPEILPFTVLGLMGGVAGAGATWLNIQMTRWRHHHLEGKGWRDIGLQIAEVALFTAATSTVWFVLPYIFGCRPSSSQCSQSIEGGAERCPQLQCSAGSYSEIGAFVYSSSDEVARLLFDRSLSYAEDYHVGPLIVYGVSYWLLVSLIYGAFVPGGLFVPSIVVGGMYGRVLGIFVEFLFPSSFINPGVYALLGAASMLGGFTRLALPVVLMLIELTGDATYLLPIMYCAMVGKFSADALFPPLYPQHMALEKIPTLTDQLNPAIAPLSAAALMIRKDRIACLGVVERLSVIRSRLLQSKRVVFPLLNPSGQLVGCIGRRAIMRAVTESRSYATYQEALLFDEQHNTAQQGHSTHTNNTHSSHPPLLAVGGGSSDDFSGHASNTVTHNAALSSSSFTRLEDNWMNLRSFSDQGVITAHPTTPAKRLQMLFRRLGIAHLCVTDRRHHFLGFVTRRCLIYPPSNAPNNTPPTAPTSTGQQRRSSASEGSETPSSSFLPSHQLEDKENAGMDVSQEEREESVDEEEEVKADLYGGPRGEVHQEDEEQEDEKEMSAVDGSGEYEADEDAGDEDEGEEHKSQPMQRHAPFPSASASSSSLSFAAQHRKFAPS